jgi:hypothetical protein
MHPKHNWRFFRAGGFDQVRLDRGADLMALDQLDQKLWVALACPTSGLEFDAKTLALIDTDKDGRIRPPELIAAVKWAGTSLKSPDELLKSSPSLPLSSINDSTPEGKQLLASARQILSNLGEKDAAVITLEHTADTARIFAQTKFNGDGIVPADSAEDAVTTAAINDIIGCLGSETDRSGKPGITQARVDRFFQEAQAFSDWWKKAETDSTVLPLAGDTLGAAAAFQAIRPKIDDYFARCRLAAFDSRSLNALNRDEKEYLLFTGKDLSLSATEVSSFPLAQVSPAKPLPLKDGVNPAWAAAMDKFQAQVVRPIFNGSTNLTESNWAAISAKFAPYETWQASKAGAAVEKLGLSRVRELLTGKARETITALVARDQALKPESDAIAQVDKLIRYHRDLYKLVNNFVSFHDFYSRRDKAIFQAGTLYLDQRSCELCMTVEDPGRHALMAGLAGAYLAYCDCARKSSGEKLQIVAAFTDGDSDNLMVGRNGVFYDRKGRDWDATISKILDNPISIRQAFWAPYKKFVRMVEEQIAKRAAAADAVATDRLAQAAAMVDKPAAPPPAGKPGELKKFDVGVVAALGVAVGAIGGALASLATGIMRLDPWQIPLVFVGLVLLISVPSMLIAFLKLRKRNLGPILDANGWAVNARAKINVPFGGSLTHVATLPPGSQRDLVDPFAEKKRPWGLYITLAVILLVALGWALGKFDQLLPDKLTSSWVIRGKLPGGGPAPAPAPAPTVPANPAASPVPTEQPK